MHKTVKFLKILPECLYIYLNNGKPTFLLSLPVMYQWKSAEDPFLASTDKYPPELDIQANIFKMLGLGHKILDSGIGNWLVCIQVGSNIPHCMWIP